MATWFENLHNRQPTTEPFPDQQIMLTFKRRQDAKSTKAVSDMLQRIDRNQTHLSHT